MYGKVPYVDVPIIFTGLRPGEKMKEELLMMEEGLQQTSNKLIFIGKQLDIDEKHFAEQLRELRDAALTNNEAVAVRALHQMVPTYVAPEEYNSMELQNISGNVENK
jgi:FlaA1/EpsC-like NDP-sugar epimerase